MCGCGGWLRVRFLLYDNKRRSITTDMDVFLVAVIRICIIFFLGRIGSVIQRVDLLHDFINSTLRSVDCFSPFVLIPMNKLQRDTFIKAQAQIRFDWNQIGPNISGEAAYDNFGLVRSNIRQWYNTLPPVLKSSTMAMMILQVMFVCWKNDPRSSSNSCIPSNCVLCE